MFSLLLAAHNLLRWAILLAGTYAVVTALLGLKDAKPWTKRNRLSGVIYVGLFDLQLLLGLGLYFLSPTVKTALNDMATAMKDHELRFFAVEHITEMTLALILAHVGSVLVKKAATDVARYRAAAIFYGVSFVLVLAAIPWWRPMVRF